MAPVPEGEDNMIQLKSTNPQTFRRSKSHEAYIYVATKTTRLYEILKLSQIEVITFVYMFAYIIRSVTSMTMIMDKVCRVHLAYSPNVCDNLNDEGNKLFKIEVEKISNNYHLGHTLIQIAPSAIFVCFVGPWSDIYGRKPPLMMALVGIIFDGIGATFCAYFMDTRVEYYLLPALFTGISGGFISVLTIVYSSASDCSAFRSRTMKYAFLELAFGLGMPLGGLAGGWVFKYAGYSAVFVTSVGGHVFGLIWVVFVMDETRGIGNTDSWKTKLKKLFCIDSIRQSFHATAKKRPNRGRAQIWLLMVSMGFAVLAMAGTGSISYVYAYHRYGWGNTKFSTISAVISTMSLVIMICTVPLFTKVFKLGDPTLGIIGGVSTVAKFLGTAMASEEWIYYVANILGMLSGLATLGGRSRISKIVSKAELGKVFAFLSTAESLVPILASVAVMQLFNATANNHPGITFFVMALLSVVPVIIYAWLACLPSVNYEEMQAQTNAEDEAAVEKTGAVNA